MSVSRFNRHIGRKQGMALRWRASREKHLGPLPEVQTRQRIRATRRKEALKHITELYGGELRRIRRAMAFVLAKRER